MDEDFYGNAVGSYSSASKSVVAKKALRQIIEELKDKLRIGLATYRLPNNVDQHHIHNSPYFVSYEPKSYCPTSQKVCSNNTDQSCTSDDDCSGGSCVDPCVEYCKTGDQTYKSICESQCQQGNPSFDPDYFDEIITIYSIGSEERNRYCELVYPKTQAMVNPTDSDHFIYYKHAYPFYSEDNEGTGFSYSVGNNYDPHEGCQHWFGDFCATDLFNNYSTKTGTSDASDGYSGYLGQWWFGPTDTDIALGYWDFGRRNMWYHVGRTWFSNYSPGDGYIAEQVADLVDEFGNETSEYTQLWNKLDPKENDETGYMSCTFSNKNSCSYVINAGLTPTAGTLQTAIDYFTGANSPIQYRCQANFIVYVTDGLPSVDESGNSDSADNLMPDVLAKLDTLRSITKRLDGTDYDFDIKTYVLGVGLSDQAKTKLDEMAEHGGTAVNGHAYYADNPDELVSALNRIFSDIVKQVASGTAASILSEKGKAGSAVLQAVFYPEKQFGMGASANTVDWIGYLYDWWLFNRNTGSSVVTNIREDNIQNKALDVCEADGSDGGDHILHYVFDNGHLEVEAYTSDQNGNEAGAGPVVTYGSLSESQPVSEVGQKLREESAPLDNRTIYTVTGSLDPGSPSSMIELKNVGSSKGNLFGDDDGDGQIDEAGESDIEAKEISLTDLIHYVYGVDISGYRTRQTDNSEIWKLSDIVHSTPKAVAYDDYSVVYVGGNDGMLHAFRLGKFRYDDLGPYQQVRVTNEKGDGQTALIGKELWAFVPKNSLPYLRFLADPNYCHLYYVDLTPYIIELDRDKDGKIDKRILIGGMRFGGATGSSSGVTPPQDTCPDPSNYDPSTDSCLGLSSYFALDVTDPESPQFLWEFTDPNLGFTYSGPAFIKRKDGNGDAKYFVCFVSGPTNYEGSSDQDLKIFVLKLNDDFTLSSTSTIDGSTASALSSFNNSFGGRLFTEGIDYDDDDQTDMFFFGVTKQNGSAWQGNVIGVKTDDLDPANWDVEKVFNSSVKPITGKIAYMKCFDMNYIFFGTGRYFFNGDDPGQNPNDKEKIYGVRVDDCLSGGNCNINASHSSNDACNELQQQGNQLFSWYLDLNPEEDDYFKERLISDPTTSELDAVFFTTTEPTSDLCSFGGRTRIWGLNCATGEPLDDQNCEGYITNRIMGSLFLQTSVGKITKIDIDIEPGQGSPQNPFTQNNNRTTQWSPGISPETPTPFFAPSQGSSAGEIVYQVEH